MKASQLVLQLGSSKGPMLEIVSKVLQSVVETVHLTVHLLTGTVMQGNMMAHSMEPKMVQWMVRMKDGELEAVKAEQSEHSLDLGLVYLLVTQSVHC